MEESILLESQQLHNLFLQGMDEDILDHLSRALVHTQRLASIGSLTTGVAHELANPLSVITAACNNLLSEMQANTLDQKLLEQYVGAIERNAFRSAHVVEVLHNYAHTDEPRMAVTDVSLIVRDSLILVEQQFLKQDNVAIFVELPQDCRSIVCDHNRITQVLVNLLANACDAMKPGGGTIQLRFWTHPASEHLPVHNGSESGEGKVEGRFAFSVMDSGPGIAPDIMDEIFKPFFTTKVDRHGVGLGLFVTEGIVRRHNGRIWVKNNPEPNSGATFTVVLPVRSEL